MQDSPLIIGSRSFQSRLLVGTGKYKDLQETDLAIQASGAENRDGCDSSRQYWSTPRPTKLIVRGPT